MIHSGALEPGPSATYNGEVEPQQIGRYVIERKLGHGALATVFRARDTKLERLVALKLLSAEATDPDLRRRFQLEARATANLKHPNIIETYDYSDEDTAALFLVMEYIKGPNLHQLIEMHGPVPEQVALAIGLELARALEYAHDCGIVHRDLKPSNVMIDEGRVVLVDFGGIKVTDSLAVLGDEKAQDETRPLGTPGFMAPEQFEGRNVDPRTDLFALGALLYHITTGRLPYHGDDNEELYDRARRGRFRDPRDHQPLLTPAFCYLLADCLAARPEHRIGSAAELKAEVERLVQAHGITDAREELRSYQRDPAGTTTGAQRRSVTTLMRDLRVALLRELQAGRKRREDEPVARVIRQLQQLAAMESPDGTDPVRGPGAPVLHAARSSRRVAYLVGGVVVGAALVVALEVAWLGPSALRQMVEARGVAPVAATGSSEGSLPTAAVAGGEAGRPAMNDAAVDAAGDEPSDEHGVGAEGVAEPLALEPPPLPPLPPPPVE